MDMNEHFILGYIPFGAENAVTRQRLSSILNMSDRAVRQLIEDARHAGAIIINKQDGKGYYQSEETEDLLSQHRRLSPKCIISQAKPNTRSGRQNRARALNILHQDSHIRRRLREMGEKV